MSDTPVFVHKKDCNCKKCFKRNDVRRMYLSEFERGAWERA